MGKIARLIWIDEIIWTQFQALHPRQASKVIEETLIQMINMKIEISDAQGDDLIAERDRLKETADQLLNEIKTQDLKINAWKAKKREEILQEKKEQQDYLEKAQMMARAMKASDAASRFRIQ